MFGQAGWPGGTRAVRWEGDRVLPLDDGTGRCDLLRVNSAGLAVGAHTRPGHPTRATAWRAGRRWHPHPRAALASAAVGVDESDGVLVRGRLPEGGDGLWLWRGGEPRELVGGGCAGAVLGPAGHVAVEVVDPDGVRHLLLWHDGAARDLPRPGPGPLLPLALNHHGDGVFLARCGPVPRVLLWRAGAWAECAGAAPADGLPTGVLINSRGGTAVRDASGRTPVAINERGTVLAAEPDGGAAVLDERGWTRIPPPAGGRVLPAALHPFLPWVVGDLLDRDGRTRRPFLYR
ncbi:hypothetical protein [Actinokineospora bangkokensis]|uniref:Uncharacterized protein n=1 Tax=Actinokineospora bangkokensis TaxID=1193682 RepID=A0A1Q9LIB1_9PSEU|nr:hypothetical protein [Actinokineospora bangkokensis]OLR91787.1 hypothetical protein BJP25_25035 [Actinokineospora bangkokensis]